MGVEYNLFWRLNPTRLKPFFKAYELQVKNMLSSNETLAFMNGMYVVRAIGSTFGKAKYPQKPIGLFKEKEEEHELTEEEIKAEREKLILNLKLMQLNFKLNHEE